VVADAGSSRTSLKPASMVVKPGTSY